jgi:hypothetical protein
MKRPKTTFFQWALQRFNEFRQVYSAIVWETEPKRSETEIIWYNVSHNVRVTCRVLKGSKKRSREVYIDQERQAQWDLIDR